MHMDQVKVCVVDAVPSDTVTLTMYIPAALNGILPVIAPVAAFRERPGGRPVAAKAMTSPSGSFPMSGRESVFPSQAV